MLPQQLLPVSVAGSGRRRCCSNPLGSHPQQLLTVFRAERSLLVDIPTGWEPRTEQQPTGLIAHPAAQGRAVRIPLGPKAACDLYVRKRKAAALKLRCC